MEQYLKAKFFKKYAYKNLAIETGNKFHQTRRTYISHITDKGIHNSYIVESVKIKLSFEIESAIFKNLFCPFISQKIYRKNLVIESE